MSSRITALIVAAGQGSRVGASTPKQYLPVAGRAVLAHAIDALTSHPAIGAVRVVIGPGQQDLYAQAIGSRALPEPIIGGATRRESVARGLAAIDVRIAARCGPTFGSSQIMVRST